MDLIDDFLVHRITVDEKTEWLFLELRLSDGAAGLGEAMLGGREDLLEAALQLTAAGLNGQPLPSAAPPVELLADDQATGLLEATVRSAIDQALWDLRGKQAGLPVYRMAGPVLRTEFQLYANINRGTKDRTPEAFAARGEQAVADGFDA